MDCTNRRDRPQLQRIFDVQSEVWKYIPILQNQEFQRIKWCGLASL